MFGFRSLWHLAVFAWPCTRLAFIHPSLTHIDDDFVGSMVTAQTTSSTTKTATDVIRAKEDDVNENPQVYFLRAEVELMHELPGNTKVCFKRYEKDTNCTENGTALVRIIDNDRK